MKSAADDFRAFTSFFARYIKIKVLKSAHTFESFKNWSVDLLMLRRGVMQKKIWHGSIIGLSVFGVVTSGAFGNQTIISSSFPGSSQNDPRFAQAYASTKDEPILNSLYDTRTNISQKPRAQIESYTVKSGDTVSTIAEKYGVSSDTIKWANDLSDLDSIKPGDTLQILPVSGVAHTVKSGDTLESVAKKYQADAQAILDFPFNDIPDDQKLKIGQVIIVPDGVPPSAPAPIRPKIAPQPQYLAQGSVGSSYNAPGGGSFSWPTTTPGLSQYFSWYHPGIDMPNPAAPPIAASDGGTVVVAGWPDNWGYGNRVMLDHGNGYRTLYAHLSNIYVTVGQIVSKGQIIGRMGSTGRSTGTHLHFEIRYKGIAINPLSILR